jgi:predicted DNA-binding transcriptional regulator AlpA
MPKRYLRKQHLRVRYGDVHDRTLERMVKSGALPPPEFPLGNRVPAWDEAVLDEWDAARVAGKLKTTAPADSSLLLDEQTHPTT